MITSGPSVISGTLMGHMGVTRNGSKIISIQLEPWTIMGPGSRALIIPIPGRVTHLNNDSRGFQNFLIDAMSQTSQFPLPSSVSGSRATSVLDSIFVSDLSTVNKIASATWEHSPPISNDLIRELSDHKPGWGFVIAKFSNSRRLLSRPLTIIYDGPTLIDSKNREVLYFPGVQNLRESEERLYMGIPNLDEPTKRSMFLLMQSDSKEAVHINYSGIMLNDVISPKGVTLDSHIETMNGDFYFAPKENAISIRRGKMTQILVQHESTYRIM